MPFTHVVVDGSNIATEGRSLPSLAQLDEAVREFQAEFPHAQITVVVDATFGHRIEPAERPAFDEAQAHGELVSPPAGAIGRGDAFLLRIADRSGATILSNDSFQEFHGDYDWLFTKDRLIGGKPVPGIGWIFTPRTPVRGPKSRESLREARKTRARVGSKEASRPMPVPKAPPPRPVAVARPKTDLSEAIAAATEEVVSPQAASGGRRRRRRSSGPPPEAVNDPLTFIQFIAAHPLGSELEGEVDSFASHGCFVSVDGARCYLPLSAMGEPPPRSAREVLDRGRKHTFILQALDPQRRGIELALPGFAHVSGAPQQETVEAEIASTQPGDQGDPDDGRVGRARAKRSGPARRSTKKATAATSPGTDPARSVQPATQSGAGAPSGGSASSVEAGADPSSEVTKPALKGGPGRKAATPKAATPKAAAKKAPAKKAAAEPAAEPAAIKPVVAKKMVAKKAPENMAPTKKAPAKKAPAKKAPAKKASAEKVLAKKVSAEKIPAKKLSTEKAVAKKVPAKKVPAKKVPAEKAVAKKVPAEKAVAKKTAAKKVPAEKVPTKKIAAKKVPAAKKTPAKKTAPKKTTADGGLSQPLAGEPRADRGAPDGE